MLERLGIAAVLAALSVTVTGCGSDCLSLCEEADAERCWNGVRCERYCEAVENVAAEGGCEEELDEAEACYADINDICDGDQRCAPELQDFGACALPYCIDHPSDCEDISR